MNSRVMVLFIVAILVCCQLTIAQVARKPAPPLRVIGVGGQVENRDLPAPPLNQVKPTNDRQDVVYIPKLGVHVQTNVNGVVEVVSVDAKPNPIYVARKGGLKGEFFVPGDSIQGVNGYIVRNPNDLLNLTQESGWKYVEGLDNGTDIGNAYIGRVYIP